MRVLIVTQFYRPENFRINDLIDELNLRGHEVTILTGLPNYPKGNFFEGFSYFSCGSSMEGNVKVIRVPIIPRFSSTKIQLAVNYLSFVLSATIYSFFLFRKEFDLIFTYAPSPLTVGLPSLFIKLFKRIPHIIWIQDLWPEVFRAVEAPKLKLFYSLVELMMKVIYKGSDLLLVQSKDFIPSIVEKGVAVKKIEYFPNWAEELYQPIERGVALQENIEMPALRSFNLMFAGNIGAAQSIDTIVKAAYELREEDINWIILGDGRRRDWLDHEVERLKLDEKVHVLGHKAVETMPFYFSLADALLVTLQPHPVMSSWIPGKIQSYLACGKPIIAALEGAGAKVVTESNCGYVAKPGDHIELAKSVLQLSKASKSERFEMGRRALNYYNLEFNREYLIDKLDARMNSFIERDVR